MNLSATSTNNSSDPSTSRATTTMEAPPPVRKLVNRTWKTLPDRGDDVYIRDPKLKEGYMGDLTKKTVAQLEEIMERQDRVLNNKFLSSKLKDKGEKLRECREKVAEALSKVRKQHKNGPATDTPADINAMEWKSRRKDKNKENKQQDLDSDDDEECAEREDTLDPLRLMAYHSSCVKKPAQHTLNGASREEEEDEDDPTSAIARELRQLDLQDAQQEASTSCEFGDRRDRKMEEIRKRNGPVRDSFKPFRPVSNPKPIPGLVHHTARPTTTTTKSLPQQEALRLERDFLIKEKERALSATREQLGKGKKVNIGLPPPSSCLGYRDTNLDRHLLDSEDDSDDLPEDSVYDDEL